MRDKLAAIPLFEGVDAASLDRLLAFPGVEERRFERGEIVSPRGAPGGELLIFWEGRVAVNKNGLRLRELTKGDLSGVATLFSDAVTDTELTALTRVRLLRIPEEALEALIQSSAQAARNTCRFLAGRIRYLNALIDRFAGASVEENLLAYLTQRAAAEGNRFPFSATEAARRLGVGRASVYRALDALAERGLLEKTGRELTLLCERIL